MTAEQNKKRIASQLQAIAEDIENLPNFPSKVKADMLINELYQVMRQLSDFSESGY